MHEIVYKKKLSSDIYLIKIKAPLITEKLKPGQFVVILLHEKGERFPLTIADFDRQKGTITLIFQEVGKSTKHLGNLNVGDSILNCIGPLGRPSEIQKFGRVVCVGGGTGIACIFPLARTLSDAGNEVISIIGARTEKLLILESEMETVSSKIHIATDDGSKGHHGFVTDVLTQLLDTGRIDRVIAIGPVPMMKAVAKVTMPHKIKTIVSLNPIMVDATGMCGACRVFIDGEMKLTCIDGPEFDAHKVNFEELTSRLSMFKEKEAEALDCFVAKAPRNDI